MTEQHDDFELLASYGEYPGVDLRPDPAPPTFEQEVLQGVPEMGKDGIRQTLEEILAEVDFHERHSRWRIKDDVIGLTRHLPHGVVERYADKLGKEEAKGRAEVAAVGTAHINGQEVVLNYMDWEFFAGSLGSVAGEKFQLAADLAIHKKIPLVSIFSTSGVRQHENVPGLIQMTRMMNAVRNFRRDSSHPYVSILLGQAWGGVSASVIPEADISIALAGTEYGFSGPKVIETYQCSPVEKGAQRAEVHAMHRNIDVVVHDGKELLTHLSDIFESMRADRRRKVTSENGVIVPGDETPLELPADIFRGGVLPYRGLRSVLVHGVKIEPKPDDLADLPEIPSPEELYQQFEALARSTDRPDNEFLATQAFDAVPLYNIFTTKEMVRYPAITAAVGRIAAQPFLILANQPSYQKSYDGMRKIPASAAPQDYDYLDRMLAMGCRMGLPAIFLCDTLGAKPTLESEMRNQMGKIARAIMNGIDYPHPVISVVTGALGSGGGLSMMPLGDHVAMFDKGMAFVAEPHSATSILLKKASPSVEEVQATLSNMRATAADQKELGIIDEVIHESKDPYETAANLHNSVMTAYISLQGLSTNALKRRRDKRIRAMDAFPIDRGDDESVHPESGGDTV